MPSDNKEVREKLHKIFQREIFDEITYIDRMAEDKLRNGILESEIQIVNLLASETAARDTLWFLAITHLPEKERNSVISTFQALK